jgi:hypothetical protein
MSSNAREVVLDLVIGGHCVGRFTDLTTRAVALARASRMPISALSSTMGVECQWRHGSTTLRHAGNGGCALETRPPSASGRGA